MKSTIALGAAVLGTSLAMAAPAAAADHTNGHAAGKVEFTYDAPEIAESGDTVTWRWTLANTGDEGVDKVVLTHKLTPKLKVSSVEDLCTVKDEGIRCEYGSVDAGEKHNGTLVATLPPNVSGTVQINGRVTWQQAVTTGPPPKAVATAIDDAAVSEG